MCALFPGGGVERLACRRCLGALRSFSTRASPPIPALLVLKCATARSSSSPLTLAMPSSCQKLPRLGCSLALCNATVRERSESRSSLSENEEEKSGAELRTTRCVRSLAGLRDPSELERERARRISNPAVVLAMIGEGMLTSASTALGGEWDGGGGGDDGSGEAAVTSWTSFLRSAASSSVKGPSRAKAMWRPFRFVRFGDLLLPLSRLCALTGSTLTRSDRSNMAPNTRAHGSTSSNARYPPHCRADLRSQAREHCASPARVHLRLRGQSRCG